MALSADYVPKIRPNAGRDSFEAGSTIFAGGLVGLSADGLLDPVGVAVTDRFVGIALTGGVIGDDIRVDTSGVILREVDVGSSVQASVGDPVWPVDDDPENITLTDPVGILAIGQVIRFHSGDSCDVQLFTPMAHLAQPS